MSDIYRILLVDDEEDILNFLSYNLKKEGYEVHTALNGHDGIALAKKTKPLVRIKPFSKTTLIPFRRSIPTIYPFP